MAKRRMKFVPDAPRAAFTLRDLTLPDWRWGVPPGTRLRMSRRVSAGLPEEMREALDQTKAKSGLSLAEIVRRGLRANVMGSVAIPAGKKGR